VRPFAQFTRAATPKIAAFVKERRNVAWLEAAKRPGTLLDGVWLGNGLVPAADRRSRNKHNGDVLRCASHALSTRRRDFQSLPRAAAALRHRRPGRFVLDSLYHGCARSSASGRSHTRVLPPGTLCPTPSAPSLILSSSENCRNHTILVKLLTFVDFCVFFLGVLAFG